MFGGEFGAFQSHQRHFFNEESPAYQQLSIILRIRRDKLALRRGRQYLREISGNGIDFGLPRMLGEQIRSVVPWSRIFNDQEILLAINTDYAAPRSAWVTIDDGLHQAGQTLTICIQRMRDRSVRRRPWNREMAKRSYSRFRPADLSSMSNAVNEVVE